MTHPIEFRPDAAEEFVTAAAWYEAQRPGLGPEFVAEVDDTLAAVAESPERFPAVGPGVRRALVHRFPYGIFYRILADRVRVVAVFHSHRDPARWRGRA